MSFIFQDKNFLKLIYKIAEDGDSPPSGNNPTQAPTAAPSFKISQNLIDKIFNNLSKGIGNISSDAKIFGDSGYNSVTISNIANLENYLTFLQSKNVKLSNGQPISSKEAPKDNSSDIKQYEGFYVNLNGLKSHIFLLFRSPDYKSNLLYREMLGRLVAQIKSVFGLEIPLPNVGEATELIRLQPNVNLDQAYQPGDKILREGDLNNFPQWYNQNIESVSQGDKKFGKGDANGICPLLKFVYDNIKDSSNKQKINACAYKNKCPWAQNPGSESPADPNKPQGTAPGASGKEEPSIDPKGIEAKNKLLAILESGGPFYRKTINYGISREDKEDHTLFSFINNSIIYFQSLMDSKEGKKYQANYQQILASLDSCKRVLSLAQSHTGGFPSITRETTVLSILNSPKGPQGRSDRAVQLDTAKSVLDSILQIVRIICKHLVKENLYEAQRSNESENKILLDNLFISNTRSV